MILMALDHVRDFFSNVHDAHFRATDMASTWPALFFTRWITHVCAPVFVFLAGTGARLQAARGKSRRELSWFLVTRGVWIIFLEVTWIHLTMTVDLHWHRQRLQVLWAIGCAMIVLAGLIWLPRWAIAAIGVGLCAGHNLLPFAPRSDVSLAWKILEAGGRVQLGESHRVIFDYPLLAWIGVMAAGYSFGDLFGLDPPQRRRTFLLMGSGMIVLFLVVRGINRYGDPSPWAGQKNALFTIMSFLNTTKYPPSLDFLLMTLGPAILALAWLDLIRVRPRNFVVAFGRVPMFFYLSHFALRTLLAGAVYYAQYGPGIFQFRAPSNLPPNLGFALPAVYLFWAIVVVALYWPCVRFGEYKRAHPEKRWLSYL